ncbi:MAG: putative glycoside hydrolase, partial [Gemmatimonadota bacterium]|nr:putative glycoside hydrolase [Gemmatimonadota bacterium]
VYYDTQVPLFVEADAVRQVYDVSEVLARLEENDIYAIARMVVFQDPLVAESRPDLAVRNEDTGDLWRNEMGVAWVNAFEEELWDANIALATEAVKLGFEEIQYDYVRFPSDGDLGPADFGQEYTAEARETAITEFVKRSSEAIHAVGGKLAVDLFGFVTLENDEQWIGQKFSKLEPYVDFVCMMIYPSHFEEGNIASAPGHPNDYPYETIMESLERAEANVPGSKAKFRPWLQDFSYGFNGLRDYEAEDVRAQIDAAEEFGASGWLLWGDPFNVTVEALQPESARTGLSA